MRECPIFFFRDTWNKLFKLVGREDLHYGTHQYSNRLDHLKKTRPKQTFTDMSELLKICQIWSLGTYLLKDKDATAESPIIEKPLFLSDCQLGKGKFHWQAPTYQLWMRWSIDHQRWVEHTIGVSISMKLTINRVHARQKKKGTWQPLRKAHWSIWTRSNEWCV
jgi:hypothetical protein